MFNIVCNIDKTDRLNRIVIGILLLLGAVLGAGKYFMLLLSVILIVEGIVGWCGIPRLVERLKGLIK